ncbi:acetamidase/formamidase family protein [Salinisphaera sp. T31B1]|uniref:acetamidase/formamidase family protein n=1 Tax=Salinisphaera sp. T31B1 TaxID=727963 RepID=UPI0033429782
MALAADEPNADALGGFDVLQPLADAPQKMADGDYAGNYYVPSTVSTVLWGYLPNNSAEAVLSVPSGSTVTFDTISHEGILEDQGRDPVAYFAKLGVPADGVLEDAVAITGSDMPHDFKHDGPHIVTGPVAIEGAEPGDVLKVEVIKLEPRVPYGVISNRHGKGALPGEYPKTEPEPDPSAAHPERYGNVSVFAPIEKTDDGWVGVLEAGKGRQIRFPLHPFMGIMGVAPDTDDKVNSVPPMRVGGNADINDLGAGSTVYYPVAVPGAMFYTGDSHFTQGDGEVALTALEGSMRATLKLTLLKSGQAELPGKQVDKLLGETSDYWITVGLDPDLDLAMKDAVRESIRFLHQQYDIEESLALAYLSAATDFEVSQVVDKTKGIHAMIRKADFADFDTAVRSQTEEAAR